MSSDSEGDYKGLWHSLLYPLITRVPAAANQRELTDEEYDPIGRLTLSELGESKVTLFARVLMAPGLTKETLSRIVALYSKDMVKYGGGILTPLAEVSLVLTD